jgi:hypothetical protein
MRFVVAIVVTVAVCGCTDRSVDTRRPSALSPGVPTVEAQQ